MVILDEPISGLDPQQIVEMRKVVRSLKEHATVLISSHILSEIEQTCDRILVIHRGKLVFEGSGEDLEQHDHDRRLSLMVRGNAEALTEVLEGSEVVESFEQTQVTVTEHAVTAVLTGDHRGQLVRALVEADVELRQMTEARSELERVFLQLTGEAADETAEQDVAGEGEAA